MISDVEGILQTAAALTISGVTDSFNEDGLPGGIFIQFPDRKFR